VIQVAPSAADAVMLLTAAVVVAGAAGAVGLLARSRLRAAAGLAYATGALIAVYCAVDVGAGLASRPVQLGAGELECFDDWCAGMAGARAGASGALLVDVTLENLGRGRAMRSDLARAYLEVPGGGRVAPADGRGLQALLQPGQRATVRLTFPAPPSLHGVRFVVVEGADGFGPGTFEIGGEGSPFHARAGWPLGAEVPDEAGRSPRASRR
jgi:hypothetical protein